MWISFRLGWLDLLAVQNTLKSLLQYHDSKASILWGSAFFRVQFSYPYMTTGKDPDARKDRGQEEKGTTKDEMTGWHHRFNGHDFEQTLGDSEG